MYKLPPASLYRLRCLSAGGPRTYRVSAYMRRLEVLGLIEATAGDNPSPDEAEYRITPAGLAELADRGHTHPCGVTAAEAAARAANGSSLTFLLWDEAAQ